MEQLDWSLPTDASAKLAISGTPYMIDVIATTSMDLLLLQTEDVSVVIACPVLFCLPHLLLVYVRLV
jgi:hypothetical protein